MGIPRAMARPRSMARGESMLQMDVSSGSQKDARCSERSGRDDDDCSTNSRSDSETSLLTNICGDHEDGASCDVSERSARRSRVRKQVSWYAGHPAALMPTPDELTEVSLLERFRTRPLYPTLTVAAVCIYCAWISRRR